MNENHDVHHGARVEEHEHLVAQRRAELGEDAPLGHRVGARGEVVVVVMALGAIAVAATVVDGSDVERG